MRLRTKWALLVIGMLFGLASTSQAQSVKLLAPNVGWMVPSRDEVLWTTDGGTSWKNITPPEARDGVISALFFLDTHRGWVLLAHGEPDIPGGTQLDLGRTEDAGGTWSMKHMILPARKYSASDVLNGGTLTFVDSLHGWLALRAGVSAGFQGMGVLLVTSDGGETWKLATATGFDKYDVVGQMVMVTPQEGWLVGGGANEPLLVTRDGGFTWQTIDIEPPVKTDQMRQYDRRFEVFQHGFRQGLSPAAAKLAARAPQHASYAAYDLPTFIDSETWPYIGNLPGRVVLFETDDGGVSWKADRIITGLPQHQDGKIVASALKGSTWITGTAKQRILPELRMLGSSDHAATNSATGSENFGISRLSFATPSQGWVLTVDHRLFSTSDGGATWTDITPSRKPLTVTQH